VTVLYVHKVEAELPCQPGRSMKSLDDDLDILVLEQRVVFGQSQSAIQNWMMVKDAGLGAAVGVGPAEPSRVSQLQANEQPIVGACRRAVVFNQSRAKSGQTCFSMASRQELIRICTAFVCDGHRFAAPD